MQPLGMDYLYKAAVASMRCENYRKTYFSRGPAKKSSLSSAPLHRLSGVCFLRIALDASFDEAATAADAAATARETDACCAATSNAAFWSARLGGRCTLVGRDSGGTAATGFGSWEWPRVCLLVVSTAVVPLWCTPLTWVWLLVVTAPPRVCCWVTAGAWWTVWCVCCCCCTWIWWGGTEEDMCCNTPIRLTVRCIAKSSSTSYSNTAINIILYLKLLLNWKKKNFPINFGWKQHQFLIFSLQQAIFVIANKLLLKCNRSKTLQDRNPITPGFLFP